MRIINKVGLAPFFFTVTSFYDKLTETIPSLAVIYSDHVNEYEELLPHVVMADFTEYVMELAKSPKADPELSTILDHFEDGMLNGDGELKNVLSVSFLEGLEQQDSSYQIIRDRLGTALLGELKKIEEFYSTL